MKMFDPLLVIREFNEQLGVTFKKKTSQFK